MNDFLRAHLAEQTLDDLTRAVDRFLNGANFEKGDKTKLVLALLKADRHLCRRRPERPATKTTKRAHEAGYRSAA